MVRQVGVITASDQASEDGPLNMGFVMIPKAIEDLVRQGIDRDVVSVLRFIWRYGRYSWKRIHQPEIAKALGVGVRTVQRWLENGKKAGLISSRRSTWKTAGRGYICEYRINWEEVGRKYERTFVPPKPLAMKDLEWAAGMRINRLPSRFFESASVAGYTLRLTGNNGTGYVLPGNSEEVLRYVIEEHYRRSISDESFGTIARIAGTLTPRMLERLCFSLAYSKTVPKSPGYYTKVIQEKHRTMFSEQRSGRSASTNRRMVRTIEVKSEQDA
jgi:hypothetical protein